MHDEKSAISAPETPERTGAQALIHQLVMANHILFDQGIVDAFGHVSVRHPDNPERFLLARNMAPGQVKDEDILEFNLDGDAVDASGHRVYLERFIHGEIYRVRPDVMSVVHSHSHSIVPLSVAAENPLRAIFHMAGFIGTGAPVFDLADHAGDDTDLLISSVERGAALALAFKDADVVLMRGHGSTVVGASLQHAVFRAIYAETNARYQLQASQLGKVKYLSANECRSCVMSVERELKRPWDFWCEEAANRRR